MAGFTDITARENKLVKLVRSLQSSARARRENGLFVLEGLRICTDAADNSVTFKKLIVSRSALEKYADDLVRFSKLSDECCRVPDSLFAHMADTDSPQGIMAVAEMPKKNAKLDPKGRYIALENVADPSNLGAVARTAEALGASGIVVTTGGCDPYSPKALRASMGTLLRMPLFITEDICKTARENGLRTFGCVPDSSAVDIREIRFADGDILLVGNEANGLNAATVSACDINITIPMAGRAESLNAAAAAAVAMWEMLKA